MALLAAVAVVYVEDAPDVKIDVLADVVVAIAVAATVAVDADIFLLALLSI